MDLSAPSAGPLPEIGHRLGRLAFVSSREDGVAPAPTPGAPTSIEIALCSREWPGIAGSDRPVVARFLSAHHPLVARSHRQPVIRYGSKLDPTFT
jgi:hypothetical protein